MKKAGFSFIEMIIVVAIIALALPTLYAIFFIIFRQQIKINRLSIVQREGLSVVNTIESTIRKNALSVHSAAPSEDNYVCTTTTGNYGPVGTLYFRDTTGQNFRFYRDGTNITYESSTPTTHVLTSSKVVASNLTFSCTVTQYSSPIVTIQFSLCYNVDGSCATGENSSSLDFQSTITLPIN